MWNIGILPALDLFAAIMMMSSTLSVAMNAVRCLVTMEKIVLPRHISTVVSFDLIPNVIRESTAVIVVVDVCTRCGHNAGVHPYIRAFNVRNDEHKIYNYLH